MNIIKKNIWLIAALLWVGGMFYLSHQNGTDTFNTSHGMTVYLANLLGVDAQWLHGIIRKAAHLVLYFVFAVLLVGSRREKNKTIWPAVVLALVFSLLDEGTKPLIPGRHCDVEDILLNDLGAVMGYIAALLIYKKQLTRNT